MKNKKVSIILPCHNEELSISDTVISISNLLIKKCHLNNFQIIAIDDGSTDKTWKIIEDLSKKK